MDDRSLSTNYSRLSSNSSNKNFKRPNMPARKPRETANHIYYPGLQLEIRHKRSTVVATVLEYISKTKILTKINETGEIRLIGASNIRVHIEPPEGSRHKEPSITKEDAEKIKALLDTRPKSANPVGRPRIHPLGTDMSAVYRERYKYRRKQEEERRRHEQKIKQQTEMRLGKPDKNGKILVSEELKTIKIKGKPHQCNVKVYDDGTQAIAIKKSTLDPESRAIVSDLQQRQRAGENVMGEELFTQGSSRASLYSSSSRPYTRRKDPKLKKTIPDTLPPIPRPDPSLKNKPPCKYTVYGSKEQIFIPHQNKLEPKLEILDCLAHLKHKFKPGQPPIEEEPTPKTADIDMLGTEELENQNPPSTPTQDKPNSPKKLTFSLESVFTPDVYKNLDLDLKYTKNLHIQFLNDDHDEISHIQQIEDTDTNPLVRDILPLDKNETCEKSRDTNAKLSQLRQKIKECSLDELSEVLLPVLIKKISPADVLIAHSRCSSDATKISTEKLTQHLNKCKRNLSWIKNNSRNVEEEAPPEKVRRAVLAADEDNPNVDTLLFDDENQIDITDIKLEMFLALDVIKMLGTSTEDAQKSFPSEFEKTEFDLNKFYKSEQFKSFEVGPSTWDAAIAEQLKNLPQSEKSEFMQRVGNLADLENEYIFSSTAVEGD